MIRNCSILFFFFSSRRRHTRYWRDWSSDVCSSDLAPQSMRETDYLEKIAQVQRAWDKELETRREELTTRAREIEERRVGKESRSRWSTSHYKKKIRIKNICRTEHDE